MDGVIVNSMPAHARSWIKAFAEKGIAVDTLDIYRREGMSGPVSIREIYAEKGHPVPADDTIQELHHIKLGYFAEEERPLFPEIPSILELLDRNNISYALVTGSHRSSVEGSIPADLLRRFRAVICADDVTHAKPHPEPYLQGLTKLNANTASSLVIENAPMGIRAAKAADLFCLAVETSLDASYLQESDLVVPDHVTLLNLLQKNIQSTNAG